jgi:hypothetical protein
MARRLLAPLTYTVAACGLVPAVPLGALAPWVPAGALPLPGALVALDLLLGLAAGGALALALLVDSCTPRAWKGGR